MCFSLFVTGMMSLPLICQRKVIYNVDSRDTKRKSYAMDFHTIEDKFENL
jgi:hypothetical protein